MFSGADTAVPNVDAGLLCRYDGQVLFRGGWGEFHRGFPLLQCSGGLVGKVLENVQDDVSGGVVPFGFVPHCAGEAQFSTSRLCCVRGIVFRINDLVDEVLFRTGRALAVTHIQFVRMFVRFADFRVQVSVLTVYYILPLEPLFPEPVNGLCGGTPPRTTGVFDGTLFSIR